MDGEDLMTTELEPLPSLEEITYKMNRFETLCDEFLLNDEGFYDNLLETFKFATPALLVHEEKDQI